jgi:hypothetical protein
LQSQCKTPRHANSYLKTLYSRLIFVDQGSLETILDWFTAFEQNFRQAEVAVCGRGGVCARRLPRKLSSVNNFGEGKEYVNSQRKEHKKNQSFIN